MPDAAPRDRRPECVGLEGLGDEVRDRHRQDSQDRVGVALAETAERAAQPQPGERVAEARRLDVGRCLGGELGEERAERAHQPVEAGIGVGVVEAPRPDALDGPGLIGPQRDRPTVRVRCEDAHGGLDQPKAVRSKVEVPDDRRPDPPNGVRQARHPDAAELGGLRRATDPATTLEDDDPASGPSEVPRRDQAIVAAADHDGVEAGRHQAARRPRDRRTSSAAIRPFAPMIPPPGWVDEPQSQRSWTGVRNRA